MDQALKLGMESLLMVRVPYPAVILILILSQVTAILRAWELNTTIQLPKCVLQIQ